LNLDAVADLRQRLGRLVRQGPDAVCLAFRGLDLGYLATAIREAGYTKLLLALDDDRAALLAAGPNLQDTAIVSDAFVAELEPAALAFAQAYRAKYGQPPSRFAASAYDLVRAVAVAARPGAESAAPSRGGRLRAALVAGGGLPSVYGGELLVGEDGTVDHA